MNATFPTSKERGVAKRIGEAIARDVIAEGMPKQWTGLDAQDMDEIPSDCRPNVVADLARDVYESIISTR